jgi:hypothetical protein
MAVVTKPPIVLTPDEYEKNWKPLGWQLIIIGPTSTWRQDWGEWEAIRDIVQNALDECERYTWGYDSEGLYIRDAGKGIAVADFLLGPPKLKPDHARGKYGEGMKIAALALLRKGFSVRVETADRELWIIFLQQTTNGHVETLASLWKPYSRRSGTVFHFIGYNGTAFEDRFAVNLPRSVIVAEGPSPVTQPVRRFNQLIRYDFQVTEASGWYEEGAGRSRIFARDIYMRDIKSPFSYNLWGFDMAPDRHGPKDEQSMWTDMGRLWSCVTKVELLQEFLQMVRMPPLVETDESHSINMGSWDMGREPVTGKDYADFIRENVSVWKEAWRRVCGENAVIRTDDRWDGTVKHLGYTAVNIQWHVRDTLARAIMTDKDLVKASQERLREAEIIPDDGLSRKQRTNLKLARAITEDICRIRRVSAVHAAIIPPASDRVRTAGMYSRTTEEIYIASDQLESARSTIDTVIHEIAHHTSGAEDLEQAHADAMTNVASRVVKETAAGKFDEILKEVTW